MELASFLFQARQKTAKGRNVLLNFVAVSRLSGSTQAQFGRGLPSMLVGPYPIASGAPFATNAAGTAFNVVEPALSRNVGLGSTTLNASTNVANSFDLTVLDSKQFYQALLSPIDLVTLDAAAHAMEISVVSSRSPINMIFPFWIGAWCDDCAARR